mmetsp:Transcript_81240/g.161163  ORF Transcript_81240/g.161163 Transcript_81240/m.161163 type:complete len:96 (+) Transcript_81240:102-389(+)
MILSLPLTLMLSPVPSKELGSVKTNTMQRDKGETALCPVTPARVASLPLSHKKDNFSIPGRLAQTNMSGASVIVMSAHADHTCGVCSQSWRHESK